ncbi:hypothetical protein [Methylotenera sp.]|uniref:hypothetical protein n=1 Tax=Methylotenera sp. TaxID=2051956 RepID=UPI002489BDD0|nr:hypothetical protein [Methylotenera sp.]MDI1362539.1 hypothetical protein [Methylotenera sp.]
MKKTRQVTLTDIKPWDDEYPKVNLEGFVAWVTEQWNKLPNDVDNLARNTANIRFLADYEDDVRINITYERLETDKEEADRERHEKRNRVSTDNKEFELYKQLKAKFEGPAK